MDYSNNNAVPDIVFCKLFNREIDYGLCWDISNIGNDSLKLSPEEAPSCGWNKAHEICDNCPIYLSL